MKKLKDILLEGHTWERNADGSLPTLKDAISRHATNLAESPDTNNALNMKILKLEKEILDIKHQYYSVSNLDPEREKQLRQQMGKKGLELKRAKREMKTGAAGYKGNPLKTEPRWQDNDGDGKWYEPEDLNEYGEDTDPLELTARIELERLNIASSLALKGYTRQQLIDSLRQANKDRFNNKPKLDDLANKLETAPSTNTHVSTRNDNSILDLVSEAEDIVQNLRRNMSTNSVLQRTEKMGYLKAYDDLLDLLSDIGYQAEME